MSKEGSGQENRRHQRENHLGTVHYSLVSHSDSQILVGAGIDISESGMSMFSSYPLKRGQSIIIKSKLPVPGQRATVRWVTELKQNWYQVGLEFTE
jgi:hypothetical protein